MDHWQTASHQDWIGTCAGRKDSVVLDILKAVWISLGCFRWCWAMCILKVGVAKPVICPALCSPYGSGNKNIPDVVLADNDIINHMQLPRSGVHPGSLIYICLPVWTLCDEEFILCTFTEEQEAIVFHLANPMLAKHSLLLTVVTTNAGIEVTQQY